MLNTQPQKFHLGLSLPLLRAIKDTAALTNRNRPERNDPETQDEVKAKIKSEYELRCIENPKYSQNPECEIEEEMHAWLKETEPMYSPDKMSSIRTEMIRKSCGLGDHGLPKSDPTQESEDFEALFNTPWDTVNKYVEMVRHKFTSRQHIFMAATKLRDDNRGTGNQEVYLCIECNASSGKEVSLFSSVEETREKLLELLTEYMKDDFYKDEWKLPRYTRVMFVEQLQGQPATGFRWEPSSQSYVEVYRPV